MTIALSIFFLTSLVVAFLNDELERAPAGYQDDEGFHFGSYPSPSIAIWCEKAWSRVAVAETTDDCLEPVGIKLPNIFVRIPGYSRIRSVGIAASFVALVLFVSNVDRKTAGYPAVLSQRSDVSSIVPEVLLQPTERHLEAPARIRTEPSRLIQTFCQRATQAE